MLYPSLHHKICKSPLELNINIALLCFNWVFHIHCDKGIMQLSLHENCSWLHFKFPFFFYPNRFPKLSSSNLHSELSFWELRVDFCFSWNFWKARCAEMACIVLNVIVVLKYRKDCCREERDKLLSISEMRVTKNKLKQGRLRLTYLRRLSIFKDHIALGKCGSTKTGC